MMIELYYRVIFTIEYRIFHSSGRIHHLDLSKIYVILKMNLTF